jgi:hypothetical protein
MPAECRQGRSCLCSASVGKITDVSAIPINLPDDVRLKAEARAAAAGRADVADYIRSLVEEDVAGELTEGAPELSPQTREQADAMVREGLASPVRTMTAADWTEIRRQVQEGIARGGRD